MKHILTFLLLLIISLSVAQPPSQKRTLVLLQRGTPKANFSQYFQQLEAEGYVLTYRSVEDQKTQLSNYGVYQYDNLIVFANSVLDSGKGFTVDKIVEFLEAGNNILVATDHKSSLFINDLVSECGVQLDKEGNQVIDHFNYDVSDADGDHTLFVAENHIGVPSIVGEVKAPILYRGAGLNVWKENPLVIPVLRANPTAYSHVPEAAFPENSNTQLVGQNLLLVSALQARNNARMIVSGSLEMFSNRFFDSAVQKQGSDQVFSRSGNQDFVASISRWAFKGRGFLRFSNTTYKRVEQRDRPEFRIKDNLAFETRVSEWNGKEWVPYLGGGIQLEFVRLDPHVRLTLEHDSTGRYFTTFTVPDVYGVFTLRLLHGNLGYSFVSWKDSISVRPFRHDEYERFIVTAYPYYLSAFSMMFGFGIFSFLFLYYRSSPLK